MIHRIREDSPHPPAPSPEASREGEAIPRSSCGGARPRLPFQRGVAVRALGVAALLLLTAQIGFGQPAAKAPDSSLLPKLSEPRPLHLPAIVQKELPNGLKLFILEDHSQPAVWLRLAVAAGSIRDPKDRVGLAQMTAGMLDKGTPTRSESQIADTIDGLGATLGASADADYITVSANGLSAYTDTLFDLLSDITLHPTFPTVELDRTRTRSLNAITASLAEPATLAEAGINRMVYGAHPYGNFASGTPKTLNAITQQDLIDFHSRLFAPNRSTLFIVGDTTPEQAEKKAISFLGNWDKKPLPPVIEPPKPAASSGSQPQITIIDRPGAEQTEVRIGALIPGYSDPKRIAARVAAAVLGEGQFEGRLTKEIRVKRGLTYGAASTFIRQAEAGMFEISTFTKNKSTGEVLRIALEEAQKLRTQPTPGDELEERKEYINGFFNVSVATAPGVLRRLIPAVLYGGGPDDLTKYTSRVQAITASQIADVMNSLPLDHPQVVLVGDAAQIEPQVKAMGKVTKIAADALDLQSPTLQRNTAGGDTGTKPTPEQLEAGKALLKKLVEAHGGDAFLNVKQLTMKGEGVFTPPGLGMKVPVALATLTFASPGRSRYELNSGLGDIIFGTDTGGQAWVSILGKVQDGPSGFGDPFELIRAAVKNNYPAAPLPELKNDAPAGKPLQGLSITDDKGRSVHVYLDSESSLLRRIGAETAQGAMIVYLDGYKTVENIALPGELKVMQGNNELLSLKFKSFEVNKPVDDKLFQRPKE